MIASVFKRKGAYALPGLLHHHLVLERCLTVTHIPVVVCYPALLYLEFPVELIVGQRMHAYISILVLPGLLVTIRRGAIAGLDVLIDELKVCEQLFQPGASGLLYYILDRLVDQKIQDVLKFRNQVLEFIGRRGADAADLHSGLAGELIRSVAPLSSVVEEELYCVTELHNIEACMFNNGDTHAYIDDLTANLEYAQRMLYRIEARLKDTQNQAHLEMQERSEYRLRMLTIVTTIFLPLTLISAIFGMNLRSLPGNEAPHTFFVLLGVMVVFTAALLAYFAHKGWFK
jgi:magnesium transporter